MEKVFNYHVINTWTGNEGTGTSAYTAYKRSYTAHSENKVDIQASSDPAFRGDASLWNPEDMFVSSLSGCHMLWYLHLCADAKVVVTSYQDKAHGVMVLTKGGVGAFKEVTLNPEVRVRDKSMIEAALKLHEEAHKQCFISNSVKIPVHIKAHISID